MLILQLLKPKNLVVTSNSQPLKVPTTLTKNSAKRLMPIS